MSSRLSQCCPGTQNLQALVALLYYPLMCPRHENVSFPTGALRELPMSCVSQEKGDGSWEILPMWITNKSGVAAILHIVALSPVVANTVENPMLSTH